MDPSVVVFGFKQLCELAFLLFLAFTAVMTLVFYYHWARYAPSTVGSIGAMIVYTLGATLLLLGLLGSLEGI